MGLSEILAIRNRLNARKESRTLKKTNKAFKKNKKITRYLQSIYPDMANVHKRANGARGKYSQLVKNFPR